MNISLPGFGKATVIGLDIGSHTVKAVVTEAALLIESGQKTRFDFFVVVGCDPAVQIARLMKRDGSTLEEAKSRIDAQLSFERKKAEADWVIDTSGEKEHTFAETDRLAEEILRRASEHTGS